MSKPVQMWAVFTPKGAMLEDTVAPTRYFSKFNFSVYHTSSYFTPTEEVWAIEGKPKGFKIRRVTVTPTESERE